MAKRLNSDSDPKFSGETSSQDGNMWDVDGTVSYDGPFGLRRTQTYHCEVESMSDTYRVISTIG